MEFEVSTIIPWEIEVRNGFDLSNLTPSVEQVEIFHGIFKNKTDSTYDSLKVTLESLSGDIIPFQGNKKVALNLC